MTEWVARLGLLGKIEKTFCGLLVGYLLLALFRPGSIFVPLTAIVLLFLGAWIAMRLTRVGMRKAIWRLRNRLLVTYLFIAVVPIILIAVLAGIGSWALVSQFAVYLAVSELDRRTESLQDIAAALAGTEQRLGPEVMEKAARIYQKRFPGLHLAVRRQGSLETWPPDEPAMLVPDGWAGASGIAFREGSYYLISHVVKGDTDVSAVMPSSRAYLSSMVPSLGDVSLLDIADESSRNVVTGPGGRVTHVRGSHERPSVPLPPQFNRFDTDVQWFSTIPVRRWEAPGEKELTLLFVHTRPSAVLNTIFNAKVNQVGEVLPILFVTVAILFLMVEMAALVIGVSLTRTATLAVHNLYNGTQRVIEGDFSHRIHVRGKDQLAELSSLFNKMTENLERLLAIAKEKERLQAELEIAREVQEQLYPKVTPALRFLSLTATCKPARMVSGDYYDYLSLSDGRLAFAIGDVAGKGISAALLMATIQAAMRMVLRSARAMGAPGPGREVIDLTTSRLVSDLNQQLHATTAPEKYATFFFGLYDDATGRIQYTNAGHLPPFLIRKGEAIRLEVSGTVVGAFPFAQYEDNALTMESGDLLVCYTDGITEPENEYGEEFGEARLIDLIAKNADRDEEQIVALILDSVRQWTSVTEAPDDMTLLLARRS